MSRVNQAHITIFAKDKETKLFTEEEIHQYHNISLDKVRGYIIQGEYTKDKIQHYQIYIQLHQAQRYAAIKKIFNNDTIHIEPIKYGTVQDCINYCTAEYRDKDGLPKDIWDESKTYGEFKTQGQRTDIEDMVKRIKDGERLNKIIIDEPKAARLYMQYSKGFREVESIIRQSNINEELKEEYKNVVWREWQQDLLNYIEQDTDKRKIKWIYEDEGNTGKSYMTKYLTLHKDAYVITGGRKEDILYAYDGQPLIILDLPRDFKNAEKQYIYEVMEILKNGQYLSTKYQTQMKTFKIPKIIVMANFEPDYTKLSKDRYDVCNISLKPIDQHIESMEQLINQPIEYVDIPVEPLYTDESSDLSDNQCFIGKRAICVKRRKTRKDIPKRQDKCKSSTDTDDDDIRTMENYNKYLLKEMERSKRTVENFY